MVQWRFSCANPGDLMDVAQKTQAVRQVRQHRSALAWWLRVQHQYPMGIVPVPTAARILGVSGRRLRSLVEEGRIRIVEGMPGGTDRDKFVPVLDLIDGPFTLDRGRPGLWGPENRFSQDFLDRDQYRGKRKSRKQLPVQPLPTPAKTPRIRPNPKNKPKP